jgi:histidyl-tRNA synthetase
LKSQMKAAGRSGARVAVILGEQEVADGTATVRDLARGEQELVSRDGLAKYVSTIIETPAAAGDSPQAPAPPTEAE